MKNTFKKSFALLLVICMVFGMLPISAFAASTVQVSSLSELQSAVASAADGTIIDVAADIQLTSAITVNSNVTVKSSGGKSILRAADYKSYMFVVANGGELTLADITVNGNKTNHLTENLATEMIVVQEGAVLNFNEGAVLTTNRGNASVSGGGITVAGTMNMNGGTIANIHMHNSNSVTVQYGAAVTVNGGTVNMYGGMIGGSEIGSAAQNDGRNGAVGVVSGSFNMYGGSISGNVANEQGGGAGGVHISKAGVFTLDGGTVSNNNSRRNGGGFYNEGTLNIKNGTVSGNTATFTDKNDDPTIFYGGAIYNVGTVNISGGEISGNTAKSCGGAIYNVGAVNITGGTISGNVSQRYSGGALFVDGTGTLSISGGTFTGNTAGQFGGAMAVTSSASNALVITGGSFSSNVCGAGQCGADIYITTANSSNVATSYIQDCVTYTLYLDNTGSRYSPSKATPAPSSKLTAGNGYVYAASGEGHIYGDWVTVVEATCTAAGSAEKTCVNCGHKESKVLPALGHSWDNGSITKAPTCTAAGTKLFTCTRCAATRTESVAALGHSWDNGRVTLAATCTKAGTKIYTCTRCSVTKSETIPPLGHKPGKVTTVDPTCTAPGSRTYTCLTCNLPISEEIPALGHDGVITTVPPTCTTAGSVTNKCSRCDYILSHAVLPPKGHVESDWIITVPATKTSTGTKVIRCTVCGVDLKSETIPVIPDPTVQIGTVEAGIAQKSVKVPVTLISNEGVYTMGFYVAYSKDLKLTGVLAGDTFTTLVDSKLNVDPATDARASAAFAAAGVSTDGLSCYRYYAESLSLNNVTADGTVCTLVFDLPAECEYEYPVIIVPADGLIINTDGADVKVIFKNGAVIVPDADPCEHVAGQPEITVEPTCTKDGEQVVKCTLCGRIINTETVKALGHSYSDYKVTIEPTCTGDGQKVATCIRCSAEKTMVIGALGHIPGEWVTEVEPGETTSGLKTKRCTRCNTVLDSVILPPTKTPTMTVSSVKAEAGSTANVTITMENNPGITVATLYVYYDESLSVTNAVVGDAFDASETAFKMDLIPAGRTDCEDAFGYVGVSTAGKKATRILWLNNEDDNSTANGTIATLTFALPADADGTYEVGIACYMDDELLNWELEKVEFSIVNGEITIVENVCEHNWSEWTESKSVTCTENGEMTRTCSLCGSKETKVVYAEGHKYGDAVTVKEATCTEPGSKVSTCSVCGDKKTEAIPALGHDPQAPVTVDATCTEPGSVTSICKRCNEHFVQVIPAKGHVPGDWVIVSDTLMERYCKVCNALVDSQVITPNPTLRVIGTTIVSGETAVVAVRITGNPGITVATLYVYYDEALSVTNAVVGDAFDASETAFKMDLIPAGRTDCEDAFGYVGVSTAGKKATRILWLNNEDENSTANGTIAYLTFEIPAGMTGDFEVGIACYMDDELLNWELEKVEFEIVNGTITVNEVPPCNHVAGTPVTTPATCTEDGSIVTRCTICNEIISTTVIPAPGHTYSDWTVVKAATATEAGLKAITCSVCGETIKTAVIPATSAASVVVSNEVVKVGDKAIVTLTMNNNPGFFGGVWLVCYKDDINLDSMVIGDVFAGIAQNAPVNVYVADVPGYAKLFNELGIDATGVKVACIYLERDDYAANFTGNGTLATLTFSGLDAVGMHDIFVVAHPDDITDIQYNNVTFVYADGSIVVKDETQPTEFTISCDGKVIGTFKAGETVELPVPAFEDGYRFFTWEGADVTRGEYSSKNTTANKRTYTMVMPEHNVELTSKFVLVGDANGDGKINLRDAAYMDKIMSGSVEPNEMQSEAADVNLDGKIKSNDSAILKRVVSGSYETEK